MPWWIVSTAPVVSFASPQDPHYQSMLAILREGRKLALAEPRLRVYETKMAVAILVDTSSSVSEQDLARASQTASSIENARGRHWARVEPGLEDVFIHLMKNGEPPVPDGDAPDATPAGRSAGWRSGRSPIAGCWSFASRWPRCARIPPSTLRPTKNNRPACRW